MATQLVKGRCQMPTRIVVLVWSYVVCCALNDIPYSMLLLSLFCVPHAETPVP